jgi:hypothetical protein
MQELQSCPTQEAENIKKIFSMIMPSLATHTLHVCEVTVQSLSLAVL